MEVSTVRLIRKALAGGVLQDVEWAEALADPGLSAKHLVLLVYAYTKQYYLEHGRRMVGKPHVGLVFAPAEANEPLVHTEIWEVRGKTAVLVTVRRPGQVEAMLKGLDGI